LLLAQIEIARGLEDTVRIDGFRGLGHGPASPQGYDFGVVLATLRCLISAILRLAMARAD
jgi:hypothetical protein